MSRSLSLFVLLAVMAAASSPCVAQSISISGQITDQSGAGISGASVWATRGGQKVTETAADAVGHYLLHLVPGSYVIGASAPRFESAQRPFQVSSSQNPTLDLSLRIPGVEQTVTVEADVAAAALEQVPGNTSLVEPETIQRSLGITLKDVLGFTPGVLVQPRFGADESQFSIRGSGLRSNFHERGVNLFINGTPYQDADGFSDFEALELWSVRQIEVWKGANALRYGGNTSGGAINFITHSGETASPFQVAIEGGSYGLFKAQVSTGAVRGPLSYYVSLSDTEIDGYREHSQQGRQRLYANLAWRLTDRTKLRFDLNYVNAAEQLPGALTKDEFLNNPRMADPTDVADNWGRFQNAVHLGVDVLHDFSNGHELEVLGYGRYRKLWHPIYQVLDQDTRTFGGEIRYRYSGSLFGRRDHFVAGFAPQTGTQGDRNWFNVGGQKGSLAGQYGDRSNNWGFYFDNQFDLRNGLTLVVGGRADSAYRRYDDLFFSDGDQSDHVTFRAFSPKVGLTWQATEQVQLFGNVSRSYEPPLMFELASNPFLPGFAPLRPQDTWQYEIGTRGGIGDSVQWDVAVVDLEASNEILNQNIIPFPGAPFTIPSYRNSAHTRHFGVEYGLQAKLKSDLVRERDRLDFRTAYTYARYTFRDDPAYGDNWLPGQPRHLLRAELTYQHPSGFWFGPTLDWSPAEYFADSANTARNDQYAVLGFKAGYDQKRWSLFLEANNMNDRLYSASVQVDAADLRFYEPANRCSVYGGVRWHF